MPYLNTLCLINLKEIKIPITKVLPINKNLNLKKFSFQDLNKFIISIKNNIFLQARIILLTIFLMKTTILICTHLHFFSEILKSIKFSKNLQNQLCHFPKLQTILKKLLLIIFLKNPRIKKLLKQNLLIQKFI